MPSGGERKSRGSPASRGSAGGRRRKLPGDDMAEVLYLTPADDSSDSKEKNDVADRFDEIDDIFGDDLADEPEAQRTPKKRAQATSSPAEAPATQPKRFPGVTFVEVFLPCRRANCKVCDGANGSSPRPVAVSHPFDTVGHDRRPGQASDYAPRERRPGDAAGPKPGAASRPKPAPARAAEEREPTDPERPAPQRTPPRPASAAEKPAARPTRPVATSQEEADEPEPVAPERPAPHRTPPRPGSELTKPAGRPTRAVAARQEPAGQGSAPQTASPSRPSASGRERPASQPAVRSTTREPPDGPVADVEWRGRVDLEEHGFEFTSESGARGLRRHGVAPPLPERDALESDGNDGDLQSRMDRLLERAKRIGYQRLSSASERSSGPSTRAVDRQPSGGPTQ